MVNINDYRAVTQTHAKEGVSDKYSFIPTTRALEIFSQEGWSPNKISEARANKPENSGFQKHLIRLRNPNITIPISGIIPEIILINAHNRTAQFEVMAGVFRMACANGLIIADSLFATQKIRHIGFTADKVREAIYNITKTTLPITETIVRWEKISLNDGDQMAFAISALELITPEKEEGEVNPKTVTSAKELLRMTRSEDREPTLWNTLNIVQEKMIKGTYHNATNGRKARPVRNIGRNVSLNKALWSLAELMETLKTQQ